MKALRVASELQLPLELVTQTIGVLAKRGAGKTYTAAVLAEEILDAGLPVIICDPVGVFWGLRADADGKRPGLSILVMGGDHGDVPLEPASGELVADLVVDERIPVVLDLSRMRKGEQTRFMEAFAERLYHRNRQPLHLVLDEADAFAPQRPLPGEQRLLGAIEDLVRRGRARGIGLSLITQRAAVLNKNVLTQVQVLVTLRMIAPQDRDAIDAWISVHGTVEQRQALMASLAALPIGTAWWWSPGWPTDAGVFQRVRIRKRRTFDSSATPAVGQKVVAPKRLAEVDLESVRARMAATVERARANDPRELRTRISALERELQAAKAERPGPERVLIPAVSEEQEARLRKAARAIEEATASIGGVIAEARAVAGELTAALTAVRGGRAVTGPGPAGGVTVRRAAVVPRRASSAGAASLPSAQQRILDAVAWLHGVGISRPDKTQAALFADLTPGAGHTVSSFGALRALGLIDYPTPGTVSLTAAGRARADASMVPQGADEMQRQVLAKLPSAQRRILEVLLSAYPHAAAKDEVAAKAGLVSRAGHTVSSFGRLRSLGLIDYPTPGTVVALPVLFLEGGTSG